MSKQREALKMALEALEFYFDQNEEEKDAQVITAIREALAEPEQEPVAQIVQAFIDLKCIEFNGEMPPVGTKLYTAPPARKPLTDEEVLEIGRKLGMQCVLGNYRNIDFDYARAIERAHGIGE